MEKSSSSRGVEHRADDPDPEQHEHEDRDGAQQRKPLLGHRADGQECEAEDEQQRGAEDEPAGSHANVGPVRPKQSCTASHTTSRSVAGTSTIVKKNSANTRLMTRARGCSTM